MVELYINLIRRGKMMLEDVPLFWRGRVKSRMEGTNG